MKCREEGSTRLDLSKAAVSLEERGRISLLSLFCQRPAAVEFAQILPRVLKLGQKIV